MGRVANALVLGLVLGLAFVLGFEVGIGAISLPTIYVPSHAFEGGFLERLGVFLRSSALTAEVA